MKKISEKIMAIITVLAAVAMLVPMGALAAAGEKYTKGQAVNFQNTSTSSTMKDAYAILMEDVTAASGTYVKSFIYGRAVSSDNYVFCDDCTDFAGSYGMAAINGNATTLSGNIYDLTEIHDENDTYTTISKAEVEDLFGLTANVATELTGTLSSVFTAISTFDGFYTSTIDEDTSNGTFVWAVIKDGTKVTLTEVRADGTDLAGRKIAFIPVGKLDTMAICSTGEKTTSSSTTTSSTTASTKVTTETNPVVAEKCYACGTNSDEYKWISEDDAAKDDSCSAVADVTTEDDCIAKNSEDEEENKKTGISNYILPLTITFCAAAIALTVITKYDLFKNI